MVSCLNPFCPQPHNRDQQKFCQSCGTQLGQSYEFSHYRVIRILGEGGFGRTYLTEDTELYDEKRVIKKLIAQATGANLVKIQELFAREGQQLYQLNHPQIPKLYAYSKEKLYLVQEYISGVTLTQELQQSKRFTEAQIWEVLDSLIPVLSYIQDQQILHRDIKPDNIMRRPNGQLVLIDFGAARVKTGTDPSILTAIYTPGYAPVEQIKGRAIAASDIYSLGVTCLRLLTGCLPTGTTDLIFDDYDNQWRYQEYLEQQGIKVSSDLTKILDKMVKEGLRNRYQNAQQVQADLVARYHSSVVTRPASVPSTIALPTIPTPPLNFPNPKNQFSFEVVTVNDTGIITKRETKTAEYQRLDLGNGVTIDFVYIPGGTFTMGSPDSEAERLDNEGPQRQVTIAPFWLGKYVVTQAQYQAIMGTNPSFFPGANRPVEQVSWFDSVNFCQEASQKLGKTVRLPSEAEWEYACRAGTTTPFHYGPTLTSDLANYHGNYTYGKGPKGAYRKETTEVGSFPPNAFGLYDCHGNVWEWCQDNYDNYSKAPLDGRAVENENISQLRILRGGSWDADPWYCRAALRYRNYADVRNDSNGFRVVLSPGRP